MLWMSNPGALSNTTMSPHNQSITSMFKTQLLPITFLCSYTSEMEAVITFFMSRFTSPLSALMWLYGLYIPTQKVFWGFFNQAIRNVAMKKYGHKKVWTLSQIDSSAVPIPGCLFYFTYCSAHWLLVHSVTKWTSHREREVGKRFGMEPEG